MGEGEGEGEPPEPLICGGVVCAPDNATPRCFDDECVTWDCDTGWFDLNGLLIDGCEARPGEGVVHLVGAGGDIGATIAGAEEGEVVRLENGIYSWAGEVATPRLTIRGEDPDETVLIAPNDESVIQLRAAGIRLERLTLISGGAAGGLIRVSAPDVVIRDVVVQGPPRPDQQAPGQATGVRVLGVARALIDRVTVRGLAAAGCPEAGTFDATAVFLDGGRDARVVDGVFEDLEGASCDGGDAWGGGGVGVLVHRGTSFARLHGNTGRNLRGGDSDNRGGLAAMAVLFEDGGDNVLTDNGAFGLEAGEGLGEGRDGSAYGLHAVGHGPRDQADASNHVENQPYVFLDRAEDLELPDLDMHGAEGGTNHGEIALYNCENITLRNVGVAGFRGEAGRSGQGLALNPAAIRITDSTDIHLRTVVVRDVGGGEAGRDGGTSAACSGIRIEGCTGCSIEHADVSEITCGEDNWRTGIRIDNSPDLTVRHSRVHDIVGGDGATDPIGLFVRDSDDVVLENLLVHHLREGTPARNGGYGVRIEGSEGVLLSNATIWSIAYGDPDDGRCVFVCPTCVDTVVRNSVLGLCLRGVGDNRPPVATTYSYMSLVANDRDGDRTVAIGMEPDEVLATPDDPTSDDFLLAAGSIAVDGGDPADDCGEGCVIDAGHHGGTANEQQRQDPDPG